MSDRTAEQEFDLVKGDVVNLLKALENSFKKKISLVLGGALVVGIGVLAVKLLKK